MMPVPSIVAVAAMVPLGVPAGIEQGLASTNPAARSAAIAAALAGPEALGPFDIGILSAALWRDGRRHQAAFWFFVFQVRSRPWADLDPSGAGAARAALNDLLGGTINAWIASDLTAWQDTARRAMSYEAGLPLPRERPTAVAPSAWAAAVAKSRREYRAGYDQTLGRMAAVELAAERRRNGLPVGPLDAPGPALLESWR